MLILQFLAIWYWLWKTRLLPYWLPRGQVSEFFQTITSFKHHWFCQIESLNQFDKKIIPGNSTRWLGYECWFWAQVFISKVFASPVPVSARRSDKFFCFKVLFECPLHLRVSPPLNLHSQNDKVPLVRPNHLPKFWGKKPKATTKVTLTSHQKKRMLDRYC